MARGQIPLAGIMATLAILAPMAFGGAPLAQDQGTPLLPGGASSLSETYGDWTVSCVLVTLETGQGSRCALSQRQVNGQGQQILAVELRPTESGLSGLMVLPFGLAVAEQVSFSIDESGAVAQAPFSTCLSAGCLVPIELESSVVSGLRAGGVLGISIPTPAGTGVEMTISLIGISLAIDRVTELTVG